MSKTNGVAPYNYANQYEANGTGKKGSAKYQNTIPKLFPLIFSRDHSIDAVADALFNAYGPTLTIELIDKLRDAIEE